VILTGSQIADGVRRGTIHIGGFVPSRVEPNSYGFHLAGRLLEGDGGLVDSAAEVRMSEHEIGDCGFVLHPGRLYLGSTVETMGSRYYAATLYADRSVATLGMWIQFSAPLGHSGAILPWTLEIAVARPLRVYRNMKIGKIAFWAMQGSASSYSGKYTGSSSAVPSRLSLEMNSGEAETP
jgi:dCTP deaminase